MYFRGGKENRGCFHPASHCTGKVSARNILQRDPGPSRFANGTGPVFFHLQMPSQVCAQVPEREQVIEEHKENDWAEHSSWCL